MELLATPFSSTSYYRPNNLKWYRFLTLQGVVEENVVTFKTDKELA